MYKQKRIKNGVRLIAAPIKGTKTITILVMVGTGSKHEDRANNGISHFLEHMFFKGTEKRPNTLAIASELDGVGGEYNAFTTKEYTGYWVKASSEKIGLAADIVSDMLNNSKFDADEIEKEKGVIVEEINMYQDNPMMYIEDLFEECLYGDTPAGWEIIGPKKNIQKFNRKDFLDYLNSQYVAKNTTVCVAGNINSQTEKTVEKFFSEFRNKNGSKFRNRFLVKEKQTKPQIKMHYKKTDQANLSLGVRTFSIEHKDEFVLKLLSIILGGSMSSRLFINLREKNGLAYYVRTQTEFYTDSGYLTTQAGVPVNKIEKAIEIILEEYKKISEILMDKKELLNTKDLILGRLTIQLEASDNVANWYAKQAILRKSILTPEEFLKKIKKININDIKRVAKNIFKNNSLNLAVIGPFKDDKKFEKILKLK